MQIFMLHNATCEKQYQTLNVYIRVKRLTQAENINFGSSVYHLGFFLSTHNIMDITYCLFLGMIRQATQRPTQVNLLDLNTRNYQQTGTLPDCFKDLKGNSILVFAFQMLEKCDPFFSQSLLSMYYNSQKTKYISLHL